MAVVRTVNRLLWPLLAAAMVALGLFWLMWQLIAMQAEAPLPPADKDSMQLTIVKPQDEPPPPEPSPSESAAPSAAQAIAQAQDVPQPVPTIPTTQVTQTAVAMPAFSAGNSQLDVNLNLASSGLSGSNIAFAAGGGSGVGKGAAGTGQGFTGKKLVPVSTGRPQIPEYAYKNGIAGWVDVIFMVDPRGQVINPRIVDAKPKGVFEAAAIEAVLSWQYDSQIMAGQTREVMQRLNFDPKDFEGNWR